MPRIPGPRAISRLPARFWGQVEKTDVCWIWRGCVGRGKRSAVGYGLLKVGNWSFRAHRVSWFLTHGEWPLLHVLHRCDNPPCVRPDHLFEGTQYDNNRDRDSKGRTASGPTHSAIMKAMFAARGPSPMQGVGHPLAKLDDAKVTAIRASVAAGRSRVKTALDFGVSPSLVNMIIRRQVW